MRKVYGLIAQAEGAPVRVQEFGGVQFTEGADCLGRFHVATYHEQSGFVGTEVDDGQINAEFLAYFVEAVKVGRISCQVNSMTGSSP